MRFPRRGSEHARLWVIGAVCIAVVGSAIGTAAAKTVRGCRIKDGTTCVQANLSHENLAGAQLAYAALPGADLYKTNLSHANLRDANLSCVLFFTENAVGGACANLDSANLKGADLRGATLSNALVDGLGIYVQLNNASLQGADLRGADLERHHHRHARDRGPAERCRLAGVDSARIVGAPASLPVHWRLIHGYLVGPDAYLVGANFVRQNLAHADLLSVDLTGADLVGANLADANLSSADLTGANLTGAKLAGARLRGAVLVGARSGALVGAPSTLPANWRVVHGYLVGPGANLAGTNLSDINLSGSDLAGANLKSATLTGTNLSARISPVRR